MCTMLAMHSMLTCRYVAYLEMSHKNDEFVEITIRQLLI